MPAEISLTIWDHVFALLAFLLLPAHSAYAIGGVLEKIREDGEPARVWAYRQTIFTWLVMSLILLVFWSWQDRSFGAIGFQIPGLVPLVVAFIAGAVFLAAILLPLKRFSESDVSVEEFEEPLGQVAILLPRSAREGGWFQAVSVNAGITEEIVFRAYLIWYLQHYLPLLWSAVLAALIFGLGHLYQGARQLPGLLLVSSVAVALYVYTESLLVPIIMHIVLDSLQGRLFVNFYQRKQAENPTAI